jgi:dynein heavy chain
MKVMKVISDVSDVTTKYEDIVSRMKEIVNKLKKHGVPLVEKNQEDPLVAIDSAVSKFKEITDKVSLDVRVKILPLMSEETKNSKKRLDVFKNKVNAFKDDYKTNLPFSYDDKANIDEI